MKDIVDYAEKSRIRKRKRQFFALLIGVLIGMMPTVNVLAATIDVSTDGVCSATTANAGDTIRWNIATSGGINVTYVTPSGEEPEVPGTYANTGPAYFQLDNKNIENLDHWDILSKEVNGLYLKIKVKYVLRSAPAPEKDEATEAEEEEPVINHNPDALNAHYYLNGMLNDNYLLGKTEQSSLGRIAFNAARPKGWNKAFSMSMSYQGRNEYSQKDGTIVLYVPDEYQKKGRKYAIMAIDKSGNVTILEDTDIYPYLVTVSPRLEGYAYELIYSD